MNQFQDTMQKGREGGFLRAASDAGILLSLALWVFVQTSLISITPPASLLDTITLVLRVAVALVMAACSATVLPALLAAIVPGSPAGMLLQKYRRSTWGFGVMCGAAGFLAWYSYSIVSAFWTASLNDPQFGAMQSIATMIFTIIVPAIAVSWSSPMQWAAEVEQAHAVRKLELAHQAEIMLAKTAYFRALDILRVGLSNATVAERQEVAGILAGLQRAQNDALGAVVSSMKSITGAELAIPGVADDEIVKRYDLVAQKLDRRILDVNVLPEDYVESRAIEDAAPIITLDRSTAVYPRESPRETVIEGKAAHVNTRLQSSIPRANDATWHDATSRHSTIPRAAEYEAAFDAFGTVHVWTARELSDVLKTAENTARESIGDWKRAELLDETRLGRYRFRNIRGEVR